MLLILRDKNITGNAETPFLLARVNELTGGRSLASSILSCTLSEIFLFYLKFCAHLYFNS